MVMLTPNSFTTNLVVSSVLVFWWNHGNCPVITLIPPPLYILIIETWPTIQIHHNQRKEALLKKSVVCLLTCAFSAIMISELSSAIIIQSHSEQIQIRGEDIPELDKKTLTNRIHRQIDFGTFQPIIDTYFPGIFKKTAIILPAPIHSWSSLQTSKISKRQQTLSSDSIRLDSPISSWPKRRA